MREFGEILAALAATGLSDEQHALIAELVGAVALETPAGSVPVRSSAAIRQARYRERKRNESVTNRNGDVTCYAKERSPTPPKENTPLSPKGDSPPKARRSWRDNWTEDLETQFKQFWAAYPNRKAPGDAKKAFASAVKRTDLQTILAGVERYAKSVRGEPKKFIAHPSTWLNQDRWEDEGDVVQRYRPVDASESWANLRSEYVRKYGPADAFRKWCEERGYKPDESKSSS